ncbi:MAG: hypothetical protein D6701_11090 [Gemmatimonadetes bacterium]|nr:MAG: hypothetical protein D6701_11090 [Gemmatimonadota bacterium]
MGIRAPRSLGNEGFALALTMLVVLVVGALATAAAMVGSNHLLANRYYERQSLLEAAADAGIEVARARINGMPSIYPDSGYVTLENGVSVKDGDGNTIPGVKRWTYVGPTGLTSGQYGIFGTIISQVKDDGGGEVIRRTQVYQESFAKFAYFTDFEPSNIKFGGGDAIFGPLHTNSPIRIYSSGATFYGEVRTAQNVENPTYGTFKQGYEEYVPAIPMPATAELSKLQAQAAAGMTAFVGDSNGDQGSATTRIEFIAIDLNGDGDTTDPIEGFFRVYQSTDPDWVVANVPVVTTGSGWSTTTTEEMRQSPNCGWWTGGVFVPASQIASNSDSEAALISPTRRCYLGGSDSINNGFVANDGRGQWLPYPGVVSPLVAGRPDGAYLFPLSRRLNPNFKGVIHVTGKVAISGTLRGKVTLAATDDIILADDVVYATNPGAGTCQDILGMFAGDDVVVSDNTLNAPVRPTSGYARRTYDDTKDEFFHGVVLALDIFTVENYGSGGTSEEPCESKANGRGCLYLTGGIIQRTRGAVGTTGGTGYIKRYSYDQCAASEPPPYFPTTGHFSKGTYYQVDPAGFSVSQFFAMMTPRP